METPQANTPLDGYQLAEYNNIAGAHFHTIEAISAFFRYYLLLMAVPASVGGVLLARAPNDTLQHVAQYRIPLGLALLVFSLIGVCVLLYIISLRLDVILYARAVNSIRRYFYSRSDLPIDIRHGYRGLPQRRSVPAFHEKRYFTPVVLAFALFNSLYMLAALYLLGSHMAFPLVTTWNWLALFCASLGVCAFFVIHPLIYRNHATIYEREYLRAGRLGIDIDGVLNRHREHFCQLLLEKTGKSIDPDSICVLPVTDGQLDVTHEELLQVLSDVRYWTEMPVDKEAVRVITKARQELGLQIEIVTHRPWPMKTAAPCDGDKNRQVDWSKAAQNYLDIAEIPNEDRARLSSLMRRGKKNPIEIITEVWLKTHAVPYDAVYCESDKSALASDSKTVFNRYRRAQKGEYKFFIEDEVPNANRLAPWCEHVFLVPHPYNGSQTNNVSGNVVRVSSWQDLYKKLQHLADASD